MSDSGLRPSCWSVFPTSKGKCIFLDGLTWSRVAARRLGEISDMAQKLEKQSGLKKLLSANRNADILKDMNERLRQSRDEFAVSAVAVNVHLFNNWDFR